MVPRKEKESTVFSIDLEVKRYHRCGWCWVLPKDFNHLHYFYSIIIAGGQSPSCRQTESKGEIHKIIPSIGFCEVQVLEDEVEGHANVHVQSCLLCRQTEWGPGNAL